MRMTREYEICLNLYGLLSKEPKRCGDLAEILGTSRNHLHGLTRKLRIEGIVSIDKGSKGGIKLPERDVSAFDVAKAIGTEPKPNLDTGVYSVTNLLINKIIERMKTILVYQHVDI